MLLADGAAAPGIERVSLRSRVVARQSGSRLHRYCGHAADAEIPLDHMGGGGESTIRCDCITEHRAHEDLSGTSSQTGGAPPVNATSESVFQGNTS